MLKKEVRHRILLVDDSTVILNALARVLSRRGKYDVLACSDGLECLRVAPRFQPEVILLDVMMPNINGFETCRRLKEIDSLKDIPVLFMSAAGETKHKVEGLHSGAVDYLTKPVQTEELLARIHTHLTIGNLQKSLLQARDEYKSLVHMMCHDLANYLGCIQGYSALNLKLAKKSPEKGEHFARMTKAAADRASEFVQQIREFQANKELKLPVHLHSVNLKKALEETETIFATKLEDKGLTLNYKNVDEATYVFAEQRWLNLSVLNNLISNAIKFSFPESQILIESRPVEEEKIELSIQDFGMGIQENRIASIFEPRSASSTPGTNNEQGTGFGMPLVKQWMESFGGEIKLSSKWQEDSPEDHGTMVKIIFNKAKPNLDTETEGSAS